MLVMDAMMREMDAASSAVLTMTRDSHRTPTNQEPMTATIAPA